VWNDQPALYFLDGATRVFSPFPIEVRQAASMDHHGRALWGRHNAYASAGQYRQRGDHHRNICRSTVPQRSRSLLGLTETPWGMKWSWTCTPIWTTGVQRNPPWAISCCCSWQESSEESSVFRSSQELTAEPKKRY